MSKNQNPTNVNVRPSFVQRIKNVFLVSFLVLSIFKRMYTNENKSGPRTYEMPYELVPTKEYSITIERKVIKNGNEETITTVKKFKHKLKMKDAYLDVRNLQDRVVDGKVTQSAVDNVKTGESILSRLFYQVINGAKTLYQFMGLNTDGYRQWSKEDNYVLDLMCYVGTYVSLNKFKETGFVADPIKHRIEVLNGEECLVFLPFIQSPAENRTGRVTLSCLKDWDAFSELITGNAGYLKKACALVVKAITRHSLAKTSGKLVKDFKFRWIEIPDFEVPVTFKAHMWKEQTGNVIVNTITRDRVSNDGQGYIFYTAALKMWRKAGMTGPLPAIIQFRIKGKQNKGTLLVVPDNFNTAISNKYDVLFTQSVVKADTMTDDIEFILCNVSKPEKRKCFINYQIVQALSSQLGFDKFQPHIQFVIDMTENAKVEPETALHFLGELKSIESGFTANDMGELVEFSQQDRTMTDILISLIKIGGKLALTQPVAKVLLKRKIDILFNKYLEGRILLPDTSIALAGCDYIPCLVNLKINPDAIERTDVKHGIWFDNEGKKQFALTYDKGKYLFTEERREYFLSNCLKDGEFYYSGYDKEILIMRTPLTHEYQVRKGRCISNDFFIKWYGHTGGCLIFNAFDATPLGCGGEDFDGDFNFVTKLKEFVDNFVPSDTIMYNSSGDDMAPMWAKEVLTHLVFCDSVRRSLVPIQLGSCINQNTKNTDLMQDTTEIKDKLINLSLINYEIEIPLGGKLPQMPDMDKFYSRPILDVFQESLKACLTTKSEIMIDSVKTGIDAEFGPKHKLEVYSLWTAHVMNKLHWFRCEYSKNGKYIPDDRRKYYDDNGKLIEQHFEIPKCFAKWPLKRAVTKTSTQKATKNGFMMFNNSEEKVVVELTTKEHFLILNNNDIIVIKDEQRIATKAIEKQKAVINTQDDLMKFVYVMRNFYRLKDTNTVMSQIYSYVTENVLNKEADVIKSDDLTKSFKELLSEDELQEARRIYRDVAAVEKEYCIKSKILFDLLQTEEIDKEQYSMQMDILHEVTHEEFLQLSDDTTAIAFAMYSATMQKVSSKSSKKTPYIFFLEEMLALFDGLNKKESFKYNLNKSIPLDAKEIIVYNNRYRLPLDIDPSKKFYGKNVPLANGRYKIHQSITKDELFVTVQKNKNSKIQAPLKLDKTFTAKITFNHGELPEENRNGEYVDILLQEADCIAFGEYRDADGHPRTGLFVDGVLVGGLMKNKKPSFNIDNILDYKLRFIERKERSNGKGNIENTITYISNDGENKGKEVFRPALEYTFATTKQLANETVDTFDYSIAGDIFVEEFMGDFESDFADDCLTAEELEYLNSIA